MILATAHAQTVYVWESGYVLACYFGCIDPYPASGAASQTVASAWSNLPTDPSFVAAYAVSLDYHDHNGNHYWLQAGYCLGTCPDGVVYTLPELYAEYDVLTNSGIVYKFHPIGQVSFGSQHLFQVWITSNPSGTANFNLWGNIAIDGVLYDQTPANYFNYGYASAFAEVHSSSSTAPTAPNPMSEWFQLQFTDCSNCNWAPWGSGFTSYGIQQSLPYAVYTISVSSFWVGYTTAPNSGGGGGGARPR